MAKVQIPSVVNGILDNKIAVGEPNWYEWLEREDTRTFRYEGNYTARKERVHDKDGYWYAYKSIGGKNVKRYLGMSQSLTLETLNRVDFDTVKRSPKKKPNQVSADTVPTNLPNDSLSSLGKELSKLRSLVATVVERLEVLEGQSIKPTHADTISSKPTVLTDGNATPLIVLPTDIGKHLEEKDAIIASLSAECANLRQQLEQTELERKSAESVSIPTDYLTCDLPTHLTIAPNLLSELEQAREAIANLQEQLDTARQQARDANEKLVEAQQVREALQKQLAAATDDRKNGEVASSREEVERELPSDAVLLNRLKGKLPKSKANLRDVEALLGLLSGD